MITKPAFTSRTIWLSILTIALGGLTAAQTLELPEPMAGYVLIGVGLVNFLLRLVTKEPVTL